MTVRRSFKDSTGRRILTAWRDDGTVDVLFIGNDLYPYVHRGISAAKVTETADLNGWREVENDK